MSTFAKLTLLATALWPFVVLAGNVRRTIPLSFVTAAVVATFIGALSYYLHGLGRHPHVSTIFLILFFLWPVALIVAKLREPSLSWRRMWLSVPLMSWFSVTTAVSSDYPVQGAGGGFGMLITLAFGWLYMLPIFGLIHVCFIFFRHARKSCTTVA
jgi:hypothetical protein